MTNKYNINIKDLEDLLDVISSYNGDNEIIDFDIETLLVRASCPVERYCTMAVSLDVLCELDDGRR